MYNQTFTFNLKIKLHPYYSYIYICIYTSSITTRLCGILILSRIYPIDREYKWIFVIDDPADCYQKYRLTPSFGFLGQESNIYEWYAGTFCQKKNSDGVSHKLSLNSDYCLLKITLSVTWFGVLQFCILYELLGGNLEILINGKSNYKNILLSLQISQWSRSQHFPIE